MTNLPSKVGDRYRCFILIRPDRGYGGPYGQTWRPPVWRCEDCGYELRGDLGGWIKARAADHHKCGHAPCARCGTPLARRKDGTPRQHAHNRCPGKSDGDKIEREFVKHMTAREYAWTTDRNALIEAAARVLWRQACSEYDYEWDRNAGQFRREAAEVLDAVLPLIADAIETLTKFPPSGPFGEALGIERAARLVRSLARPGTGE